MMDIRDMATAQGLQEIADLRSENMRFVEGENDSFLWLLWGVTHGDDDFAVQAAVKNDGIYVMNFWGTITVQISDRASLIQVIDAVLKMESALKGHLA
jgi:hypothetical protein